MDKIYDYFIKNKDNIEVIFFDIFDTIILRKVHPEYVKKIWAKRIGLSLELALSYEEIYKLRNTLEVKLCERNAENGFDLEFNYKTFIKELYNELIQIETENSNFNSNSIDEFTKLCLDLEIQVEKGVQEIDKDWLQFIKTVKQNNIKVVCVSDFYLPKDMISQIFKHHDILQYIDEIYVSSDYLYTKRSGRLYDKILEQSNIHKENILMVGDNEHSDFNMPKSKGINAYLIDRKKQRDFYEKFMNDLNDKKGIENNILGSLENSDLKHFEQLSLTLFAFIEKLHIKLVKKGVKNVFFLSREGEFLKKLFDLYQYYQGYDKNLYIKSHYFIVSRKSTFLPSLKSLNQESFEILFRQYRKISLYDFLSSLNFSNQDIDEIAQVIGVQAKERQEDFPTSLVFSELVKYPLFKLKYEESRMEQNKNFVKYLDSFDVNVNEEGLNLVDVGWKGTIQDNIFRILNEEVRVNGYYLGLVALGAASENNNKEGVLFSSIPNKTKYFSVYNENRALFEVLLGASHGSANGYEDKGTYIEAITHQEIEEKKLFENIIQPIQKDMEVLYIRICKVMCKRNYEADAYDYIFAINHAKMVYFPKSEQINFFSNIYHFENFGVFEFTKFNNFKKVSVKTKIHNLNWIIKNPRGFFDTGFWGPVTLQNSGLGFLKYLYGIYRYYKNILKDR